MPAIKLVGPSVMGKPRLALVGQGLTNWRIAEPLFISERTVHTHVADSLAKPGLVTRAEIAVWAVAHGLIAANHRPSTR